MVQAVGAPNPYYAYGSTGSAAPVAPTGYAPQSGYTMDAYSGASYATASMAASGSISAIVSDPKAASRFSLFLINTPQRLLSVGGGMGVVGRAFLNMLAGNVPLFTSAAERAQISNNVRLWLSSADLVRTGAAPAQATLLQDVGVWTAQDLAIYVNPADQNVLAQRLAGAAGARGWGGAAPSAQQVGMWVASAVQLPKYNY